MIRATTVARVTWLTWLTWMGQVSIVIFGMLESSEFGVEDDRGQDRAGGGVLHLLLLINGIFCKYHQVNRLLVDYECGTEAAKQVNGNKKDSSLFSTTHK